MVSGRARTLAFGASLAGLFALTAHFRFASLSAGFTNDQFFHLAQAQQMLFGEWPTRDFFDIGMPFMYAASALAQRWLGNTLFAEGVLVSLAFAAAAVLTALAARELTGSRALALLAAGLEVAIVPRAYGYPKILVYAAAFLLLQRYVTRPSTGRLAALAAGVVVAFLFRHDHGIYLGVAGVVAVWLAADQADRRGGLRRALVFAAMTVLIAAPYLAYVQVYDGIWAYVQKGLEFRAREFGRAEYVWPALAGDQPLHAVLFYAYWSFPLVAALLVLRRPDGNRGVTAARVLPLVVVALLLNSAFARPPMSARLPDAVVPFVLIGAWLAGCAWRARRRWVWRPAVAALTVVVAASVVAVDDAAAQFDRAGLLAPFSEWPDYSRRARTVLEAPHADVMLPSRAASDLVPFYDYLTRCTTTEHRVLVVGLIPEVVFFTHRPFAGGQAILPPGYFAADGYQQAVVDTLTHQTAPFVVVPGTRYIDDFDSAFPLIAGYVRRRYTLLATFGDDERTKVEVLVDRHVSTTERDEATGWPCLSRRSARPAA